MRGWHEFCICKIEGGEKMEKVSASQRESMFPNEDVFKQILNLDHFQEEKKLITKTIEKFVSQQVNPNMDKLEAHDYTLAKQLFRETGKLGLLGADVPEDYGGLSMGKRMAGNIAEKMGFGGSFSVSYNIHTGVGTLPFVYFGTEGQKRTYLPKLVSGEWVGAYALTEPHAGSDALASKTTAKKKEGTKTWKLNGEKQWITNAHIADVYVVFANTIDGITAFIVERDTPGVSVSPEEKKLGIKGSSTATVIFEDVILSDEQILGDIGKGHKIALNILNLARLKLAFANIGTSKQALAIAVEYGKERKQFQQAVVEFGMIQEKIANMAVAIYGAESSASYTAGTLDVLDNHVDNVVSHLANYAMDCSVNKVQASETLDYVIDEAVQIHGGYGYMQEYEVERIYRDARINRIFEGTNEINRQTIAKSFLKNKKEHLLAIDTNAAHPFIRHAATIINIILNAFSKVSDQTKFEQMSLRSMADIIKEFYVMSATQLMAADSNQQLKQKLANLFCEEAYQRIENNAIMLLSSLTISDNDKGEQLDDIRALPVRYSNIFLVKQEIAQAIIANDGYME